MDGDLNPKWHEQFVFHVCHDKVKDLQFGAVPCLLSTDSSSGTDKVGSWKQ